MGWYEQEERVGREGEEEKEIEQQRLHQRASAAMFGTFKVNRLD